MWLYSSPPATPESFVSFSFTATQIPLLERSLSSSSKAWKKWGKICYWKVTQSRQVHIIVMTLPKKSGKCIGKKKTAQYSFFCDYFQFKTITHFVQVIVQYLYFPQFFLKNCGEIVKYNFIYCKTRFFFTILQSWKKKSLPSKFQFTEFQHKQFINVSFCVWTASKKTQFYSKKVKLLNF